VRKSLFILQILLSSPAGYSDEKVSRLTKEAIASGFNHFKMKVGADFKDDLRRGKMIRSIIDDPANYPSGFKDSSSPELAGKNAGPTGAVLMIDANQVWDVPQAIEYVTGLAEIKPWSVLFVFISVMRTDPRYC
jgi:L-fuconate dehydratase